MDWVRLDVGFFRHPDIIMLPDRAKIAYLNALLYCGEHETDWTFPKGVIRSWGVSMSTAALLVKAGVWEMVDEGWHIRNAERRQPDLATMKEIRRQRAEFGRRGGLAKARANAKQKLEQEPDQKPQQKLWQKPSTVPYRTEPAAAATRDTHDQPVENSAAALIDEALNILADRRIAAANGSVANPAAYRAASIRGMRDQYADQLCDASDAHTAESLANWLEPPPPPIRTNFAPGSGRIPNWSKGES